MSHLKSMDWVAQHLNDENVRLIDCRFQLNNPQAGIDAYNRSHLPNAVYLDLEKDLSGPVKEHGGRHPLPNIEELANKLSQLGIDEKVTVVAYDDQNGAMASRCWWLLNYLGHENVFIMNGSFKSWENQQLPLSSEVPKMTKRNFRPTIQDQLLVSVDDVKSSLNNQHLTLIDSREEPRFKGEVEPIDKIAGHIPGALNYFWQDNINSGGTWKDSKDHEKRFEEIPKHQSIIVYCGSGVTACPNILALKEAGYKDVKLYAGSWSDWITYKDHPIGKR
ncbi:thiosulfate/3-mercaptopyruvate sulfurtransferase [Bacillus mesophilus]|uniref:Sulfurtransferase n=1 Tax=Bacillus mesophilus TaxID=1808955 RepID=A0A6M0Q405_9BACI|nr:sulfurtransferase [Bacillus mesophilus]MBM7661356.1 thiosulfate/3-mercaptopyruvate sulfurtransferase [Bacillus mesophilus]NEY71126.1 sulfurtransferase [Bacillus mesophilus]